MTETAPPPDDPPEDGRTSSESDEGGEIAPDRPADDSTDLESAVEEETAREQSGI